MFHQVDNYAPGLLGPLDRHTAGRLSSFECLLISAIKRGGNLINVMRGYPYFLDVSKPKDKLTGRRWL